MRDTLTEVLAGLLITSCAAADIVHVPGDHATIQAAIDAADHGDTISVGPGTYTTASAEAVVVIDGKSVALVSTHGADETIILGNPSKPTLDRVLAAGRPSGLIVLGDPSNMSEVTLDGFTVRNFSASQGAGVLTSRFTEILIQNCRFTGNTAIQGAAVYSAGRCSVTNCTFTRNRCASVESASGPCATAVLADRDLAATVIAVRTGDSGETIAEINAGSFDGVRVGWCMAITDGAHFVGALSITVVEVNSASGTVEDEDPAARGKVGPGMQATAHKGELSLDIGGGKGGAIYSSGSERTQLLMCTFEENQAERGGAIFSVQDEELLIQGCSFSGNSSSRAGHSIYNSESALALVDCVFDDCCQVDPVDSHDDAGDNTYAGEIYPACADCRADVNCDGRVDGEDLVRLLGLWGATDALYDLGADGLVGEDDLATLLNDWGRCP